MQVILKSSPTTKPFGIQKKPLPLEPSVLLREANRRRASLSAGNMFEIFDGYQTLLKILILQFTCITASVLHSYWLIYGKCALTVQVQNHYYGCLHHLIPMEVLYQERILLLGILRGQLIVL